MEWSPDESLSSLRWKLFQCAIQGDYKTHGILKEHIDSIDPPSTPKQQHFKFSEPCKLCGAMDTCEKCLTDLRKVIV